MGEIVFVEVLLKVLELYWKVGKVIEFCNMYEFIIGFFGLEIGNVMLVGCVEFSVEFWL